MVGECAPLDLNSCYSYYLITNHFSKTSLVGISGSEIVSFVSGYFLPDKPTHLFIWQVAVSSKMRGRGVANAMLNELINEYRDKIEYIEATVNPSNNASKSLFKKLSKSLDAPFSEAEFIKEGELEENHEAEILLQVGKIEK